MLPHPCLEPVVTTPCSYAQTLKMTCESAVVWPCGLLLRVSHPFLAHSAKPWLWTLSHLRGFTQAVPSAWKVPSFFLTCSGSYVPRRSQLKSLCSVHWKAVLGPTLDASLAVWFPKWSPRLTLPLYLFFIHLLTPVSPVRLAAPHMHLDPGF